jgi:class 3 adenylate cyclase
MVGIAFHIGTRVAAKARAGEVLVSSAVKDLISTDLMSRPEIRFKDRGVHRLKGVPERWQPVPGRTLRCRPGVTSQASSRHYRSCRRDDTA